MKKIGITFSLIIILCIVTFTGYFINNKKKEDGKYLKATKNVDNSEMLGEDSKSVDDSDMVGQEDTLTTDYKDEREEKTTDNTEILKFVNPYGEWFETEISDNIPHHSYEWKYLKNKNDQISYEGDKKYYIRKGIDVSHHQGSIDWKKVKEAGYEFAFIRIAYRGYGTEGSLNLDREFYNNINGAHDAGLDVGVYVFSQAIDESEALEEAEFVLDKLKGITLELPIVFDPELIRDSVARTDDISGEQFTKNTIVFCEKVKEKGFEPMIYSNMYWEAFMFDLVQLKDYPIWYADYEQIPQTPYQFTFWQYSESGIVPGIEGKTDLNIEFCTYE
ncbi:glycoside hydrolase family 25 protein [Anaerosporobacter sp.]